MLRFIDKPLIMAKWRRGNSEYFQKLLKEWITGKQVAAVAGEDSSRDGKYLPVRDRKFKNQYLN